MTLCNNLSQKRGVGVSSRGYSTTRNVMGVTWTSEQLVGPITARGDCLRRHGDQLFWSWTVQGDCSWGGGGGGGGGAIIV